MHFFKGRVPFLKGTYFENPESKRSSLFLLFPRNSLSKSSKADFKASSASGFLRQLPLETLEGPPVNSKMTRHNWGFDTLRLWKVRYLYFKNVAPNQVPGRSRWLLHKKKHGKHHHFPKLRTTVLRNATVLQYSRPFAKMAWRPCFGQKQLRRPDNKYSTCSGTQLLNKHQLSFQPGFSS